MQIYAAKQHPVMEKYILTFVRGSGSLEHNFEGLGLVQVH